MFLCFCLFVLVLVLVLVVLWGTLCNNRRRRIRRNQIGMEAKGGEVRRLHIIYFLSHMGRVDHPHLVRVHHFNRNGVYLRGD